MSDQWVRRGRESLMGIGKSRKKIDTSVPMSAWTEEQELESRFWPLLESRGLVTESGILRKQQGNAVRGARYFEIPQRRQTSRRWNCAAPDRRRRPSGAAGAEIF